MTTKGAISQIQEVPHSTELLELRPCAYCTKSFIVKADSTQIYCTPDPEKRLAYERRKALVFVLAGLFWRRGDRARDMVAVCERCVKDAPTALVKAFQTLGYTYDAKAQRWLWRKG